MYLGERGALATEIPGPKSKNHDQNAAYVKDISFVGRDAVGIQTLAEKLMDIVISIPVDEREDDEDVMKVYVQ
jgi:hypothetical protein